MDLRTNSDHFPIQHYRIGFYNWGGERLLRGTHWIFIWHTFRLYRFKIHLQTKEYDNVGWFHL